MINYLINKLRERKAKKTFKEYEFKTVTFNLTEDGPVQYAQWMHPGE
jgi:hypothetical protein